MSPRTTDFEGGRSERGYNRCVESAVTIEHLEETRRAHLESSSSLSIVFEVENGTVQLVE